MAQMNQMIHIQGLRQLLTRGPYAALYRHRFDFRHLPEKLHAIAAAGYQGVEIFEKRSALL